MAQACWEEVNGWWTPGDVGLAIVRMGDAELGGEWVAVWLGGAVLHEGERGLCRLGGGWQGSLVVLRRDGLVVRLVVSKRQVSAWLASLCVEEVGMGKKEWVWLLIAAALFVTWLVVVGASALSALQHAL